MSTRTAAQIALDVKSAIETSRQNLETVSGGQPPEVGAAIETLSTEINILAQAVMDLAGIVAGQSS